MTTLGIRCSNSDFSFAVLTGTQKDPYLVKNDLVQFPRGFSEPEKLKWFLQELEQLNRKYSIDCWAVKCTESAARKGKPYTSRVGFEAIVSLSAANQGSSNVLSKVKPTIAKDLGLQGNSKALTTDLDHSKIDGLNPKNDKAFDSIVVAWSTLE